MITDLNTPLVQFSHHPADVWRLRDAVEGTSIMGGIGSGKTSGSGALLAAALLRAGAGALFLCAKQSEPERLRALARACGREQDIISFSPRLDALHQQHWCFNFLDYELTRPGFGAGLAENMVELLNLVKHIIEGKQELATGDPYWNRAVGELTRNAVSLLLLSQQKLSIASLYRLMMEAPKGDQAEDVLWQRQSYCWHCLEAAKQHLTTPRDLHNYQVTRDYWLKHFASLADRTRSSILSSFTTIADVLLHDDMHQLFGTETNLTPEMCYEDGRIILLDMPVREYGRAGVIAQRLFKTLWQRAMLRRPVAEHPRPVMLYVDEAQNFIDEHDVVFQAEARESRVATLYMTQSITNYYAVMGAGGRDAVQALLGHFQTKIFHANSDVATNEWAASLIGMQQTTRRSWSVSSSGGGNSIGVSHNEMQDYPMQPAEFAWLAKGGPVSHWKTEAVILQSGRVWQGSGTVWLKSRIPQWLDTDDGQAGTAITSAESTALADVEADAEGEQPAAISGEEMMNWLEWLFIVWFQRHRLVDLATGERLQHVWQQAEDTQPAPAQQAHSAMLVSQAGHLSVDYPALHGSSEVEAMLPAATDTDVNNATSDAADETL
ncbi:MAG: type IV secretory system conjugative DNA transfer family protein [Chloroflexota bacterium]